MSYVSIGDAESESYWESLKRKVDSWFSTESGGSRKTPVPISQIQTLEQVADYAYKGMQVCSQKKSEYWKNLSVFTLWNTAYNAYKDVFDSATKSDELSRMSVSAGKTHLHEADLLAAKAYGTVTKPGEASPPAIAVGPEAVPVPLQISQAGFPMWIIPVGIGIYLFTRKKGKKRGRR